MDGLRSGYILYKDLDNIKDAHPLVYKRLMGEHGRITRFDSIIRDPDVYDDFPVLFYLDNGDKIVCSRFALPDTLTAGDRQYPWAWGGNFFTDPEFRGKGLGTKLIRFMTDILHEKNIGTGQTFSTPVSLHIYNKLGFTVPGYVDRYLFLKSCAPIMRKYTEAKTLIRSAEALFRPLARAVMQLRGDRRVRRLKDYECTLVEESDMTSRVDHCKRHYSSTYRFNDFGAKLAFKMSHFDDEVFHFVIRCNDGSCPTAFFILKNELVKTPLGGFSDFKLMSLMDYGFFDDLPINRRLIVEYMFDFFTKSDAEVLDVVSSDPEMIKVLKKRGMLKIGKGMSFSFSLPESWDLGEGFNRLQAWDLTHFSGDAFSID